MDRSTVSRILQLFHNTGTITKKAYPKDKAYRKLTTPAELLILNLVVQKPGIYLREIQEELLKMLLLHVDTATNCRFLHASGFSHQKLCLVAKQRDEFIRQQFALDISLYKPEMLVFLDETGTDHRNCLRKHGYSIRGIPLMHQKCLVRGEHVTAIAIISVDGILDVKTSTGTTDGDAFYTFVQTHLLPQLMPCNGSNQHSVVIMDNCAIHHICEVVSMIEDVGALVHFLPPYSPDLNPIEEAFSKVKHLIRSLELALDTIDVQSVTLAAFYKYHPE